MLFSSLSFLFFFLPISLFFYYILPNKFKNIILLIFSLIFYMWGEPKYIILMLLSITLCYIFGLLIDFFDKNKKYKLKKITFVVSIACILGILIYFKYFNFLIDIFNLFKFTQINMKTILLPIGISFYTFQILSYLIDLYKSKIKVQKNYFLLALYISFFPQLIAGPIVRYETIENQLLNRKQTISKILSGMKKFIIGLGKKVIISNHIAIIADSVFNSQTLSNYSSLVLIIGILSYTFQIYFDFSGYSDMAIGLARVFGFEFEENFNYPYISKSITEFWKRWHISLSKFFKEYLYIPLGGNRVSKLKWIRNMFIVWFLTGLWHGSAWNYIIWGLYYCIILILEKTLFKKVLNKIPNIIKLILTFILINIGWLIFRANSLQDLLIIVQNIIINKGNIGLISFISENPDLIFALPHIILAVILSTNIIEKLNKKFIDSRIYNMISNIILIIIFLISISYLVANKYNPFIYFRF